MSNSNNQRFQKDDFYVGYSKQIPPKTFRFILFIVSILVVGVIALGAILPLFHYQYPPSKVVGGMDFEGLVVDRPIPYLLVPRDGNTGNNDSYSRYPMASTRKASVSPEVLKLAGNWVKLKAAPTYRDNAVLLNVIYSPGNVEPEVIQAPQDETLTPPKGESLGNFTLTGEIVDSKCYLGVMKPGHTKTHRDCSIRCISGGVPPVLKVDNSSGDPLYFFLVDSEEKPVNKRILSYVGDPIDVTGEVVRYGDLFILKANPQNYQLSKGA